MKITQILRHPLKSHGREPLAQVALDAGTTMPWDRVWAVAHETSKADGSAWARCANFSRGSKAPALMAITARFDEAEERLHLSHPDRPDLAVRPDHDQAALIDWVMPLVPQDRALPARVIRLDGRGFTDSEFPSVTLCNMASHRAVEAQAGHALSIHRWRGNLWFDSDAPWAEFDWIGREIRVGSAVLRARERTDRCLATAANPETGERDADLLGVLKTWGHQDFSLRCEVIESGTVSLQDAVVPL
ncbi:MOSC N-terminal beta barrel domain-containing protein [uncultured Roseobacter sp.]|uniref:MOSC domain-containing protein n=1 Tax=uncultured Roseobacter sp. TaxID=114847 RepID=UPI00261EDE6A|nr:MOSC N-terminal beta barrel domain-containing protein [uncultured Roseobacter sp.]